MRGPTTVLLDQRALNELYVTAVITAWVYEEDGRQWNLIVAHTKDEELEFVAGPYQWGHWGHQIGGSTWTFQRVLKGEFPAWTNIPESEREEVLRYVRERVKERMGG